MMENLDELKELVRESVPNPKAILQLKIVPNMKSVVLHWHGTEFVVKPSLHVYEVRGHTLFVTGMSHLLQAILVRSVQGEKKLETMANTIAEAEDMIRVRNQPRAGVDLIKSVRFALEKMSVKQPE